jgi:4-hydroxy-tetrahydrodipicolinate synthase
MMEQLLRRQLDAGIEAVVICGTTGEAPTLSDGEKLELFSRAKHYTGGICRIIAGTGSNCTAHTIRLSQAAEDCGVDALLVVTPYYNKASPDGLYAHYLAVAQAVEIPVIAYNVPGRTGMDIPLAVYEKLSKIPNLVGTKEACVDITKTTKIRNRSGSKLTVWSGNDDMTVPMMSMGAKGVISVLSNVIPAETREICTKFWAGDTAGSAALQCKYNELVKALFCEVNPIPVKEALAMMGWCDPIIRSPLYRMEEANLERLRKAMVDLGIIEG